MEAYWGSGFIAPCILDLYTQKKESYMTHAIHMHHEDLQELF